MQGKREKPDPTLKDAQDETEMVIFDAVDNLLKTTNTDPQEVRARRRAPRRNPAPPAPGWAPDGAGPGPAPASRCGVLERAARATMGREWMVLVPSGQARGAGASMRQLGQACGQRAHTLPARPPAARRQPPAGPGPDAAARARPARRSTS
jgi:hypothetical protein